MRLLPTAILVTTAVITRVASADGGFEYKTEVIEGSTIPVSYHFIETPDGLYTPIGLRVPAGQGPFPVVLFASGNGGEGFDYVVDRSHNDRWTVEQFLGAGYAVAWMRYRAEVDIPVYERSPRVGRGWSGRPRYNRSPLEYEDVISIIEYVKELPTIDADRVGYVGLSHGGEMLMKIASEYDGLWAGIASEPASAVFLARKDEPISPISPLETESETDLSYAEELEQDVDELRKQIDVPVAVARIDPINIPIFVQGRDRDHNQDVFRLNYELLVEAGKTVEWRSYDHDEHGFIYFVERNDAGEYVPDAIQLQAVADSIEFFNRNLQNP